jgi:hypothetical protein
MSRSKQDRPNPPSDADGVFAPEQPTSGSPSPQQNDEARRYCEALVARIVDVYARFTPEDMEMVEALGFGLGKLKRSG